MIGKIWGYVALMGSFIGFVLWVYFTGQSNARVKFKARQDAKRLDAIAEKKKVKADVDQDDDDDLISGITR